jgi:predicted O-linked N-acetylglucosamine transferase (SPINDLY family)
MLWKLLRSAFARGAGALVTRGLELRKQGDLAAAERALRGALTKAPRDAIAATNLAIVLLERNQGAAGVSLLEQAIAWDPQCAAAHYNFANVLRMSGRFNEAIAHYGAAAQLVPPVAVAGEELMHTLLEVCDWDRARTESERLRSLISTRPPGEWLPCISPLSAAYLELGSEQRKQIARYHAQQCALHVRPVRRKELREDGPLRIGYLSRDFRDHPVGHLLRSAFRRHDRSAFEVFAFSYGPDDNSVYRREIADSADHFIDAASMSDDELAQGIAAAGIHVLIDLAGHTTGNRMAVLARRPAPIQVHYLGYPGTTGAQYIDYYVTDPVATPAELAAEFTEQLVYLPHCFMVSNGLDAADKPEAGRAEHGLPGDAFVFCNFANSSRITRAVFEPWMEILQAVPASVLWLRQSHALTVDNLRREAQRCGVVPERLIFASREPDKRAHMARVALADVALDPIGWYNGHSSTADMLWARAPVLTAMGHTFASRVAASLCAAAGLEALVARDAADYVRIAVELANDRPRCAVFKRRLADGTAPFFDEGRIVTGLEAAYREMWRLYRSAERLREIRI